MGITDDEPVCAAAASEEFEGGVHIEIKDINGQKGCVIRSSKGIVVVALKQIGNNASIA